MGDIKPKSKSTKQTVKRDVKHEEPVKQNSGEIQVHFGNYKKVELALLNSLNKNMYELLCEFKKLVAKVEKEK